MVGGDSRHHQRRDKCFQHLDFTGLRKEFCDRRGQWGQSQELAGTAMRIMQRSVGSRRTRILVLMTRWMRMSNTMSGVLLLTVIVMRVRAVTMTLAAAGRSGNRYGAAIAMLMARMVVRHPSQMRRQQVAGQDAQSNSAMPSLHFEQSKDTVEITSGRILTDELTRASRKVLDFTKNSSRQASSWLVAMQRGFDSVNMNTRRWCDSRQVDTET